MSQAPAPSPAQAEWTPEAVTLKAMQLALAEALGPKKAERFFTAMAENLARSVMFSATVPIRGDRERQARRHDAATIAANTFRADLPNLLAAIP